MKALLLVNSIVLALAGAAHAEIPARGAQIPLWPDKAPGSENWQDSEKVDKDGIVRGRYQPTIAVYPAPADKATEVGVVVCPGGGYWVVAYEHEGRAVAEMLNQAGVTAVLLKYRVRTGEKEPGVTERALADATRAVRYLRANAKALNVNPNQIGILGFSAGGHLALNTSLHPQPGDPKAADPLERVSSNVAFQVLIYPGGGEMAEKVGPKTPPAFIAVSTNDDIPELPLESLAIWKAMYRNNVNAELHVLATGGHGYGLGRPNSHSNQWPALLKTWLDLRTWKTSPTTRPATTRPTK